MGTRIAVRIRREGGGSSASVITTALHTRLAIPKKVDGSVHSNFSIKDEDEDRSLANALNQSSSLNQCESSRTLSVDGE